MAAEFSRLTGKYQATVPASVRRTLGVGAGDRLAWVVEGDTVVLRRASPKDEDFAAALSATLGEWATAESRRHGMTFDAHDVIIVPFPKPVWCHRIFAHIRLWAT